MNVTAGITRAADRVVGILSPKRMVLRQHFRRMANDGVYQDAVLTLLRARGYRSADNATNKTGWVGGTRSADAEILNQLPALRNRSRELNRDDPIASGMTGTFIRNIVGTGLRAQARTESAEQNARLEAVWRERKNALCPNGLLTQAELQQLLIGKVLEDGEVLVKETADPGNPAQPMWLEVIEADRLGLPPNTRPRDPNGEIRDGVEFDRNGRVLGYWVKRHHPGDITLRPGNFKDAEFIPVDICCHLKRTERPGQTRGVPIFHAITQDLRDLDLLMLASLKRTQIAACLAAFIKSGGSVESMLDLTAQKYGYVLDQTIEPGMIFKLFPDEDIQTLIPNFPTPELGPFIIMFARRIGAALGISWQIVLKDFSDSTYSSARTDLLESRQVFTIYQRWFIDKFCSWQWLAVMRDARLRGDVRVAGIDDAALGMVEWIGDGWDWIDPVKQAEATKIALGIGLTTLRDECGKLGKDWEELIEQRRREQEALVAAGLPTVADTTLAVPSARDEPENDDTRGSDDLIALRRLRTGVPSNGGCRR